MVKKITVLDPKVHPRYVTVTHGMAGYFAVQMWWNPDLDGFWEPWNTGFGRWRQSSEAAKEAIAWAEADDLPYYDAYGPSEPTAKPENLIQEILRKAEESKKARRDIHPSIEHALEAMQVAWLRLRDDGWRLMDSRYPKNQNFHSLVPGSTKIFETFVSGEHPNFHFMIADGNDWWPAQPMLWKPIDQKDSTVANKPVV
jgi:predicted component of type VI protein secretion system